MMQQLSFDFSSTLLATLPRSGELVIDSFAGGGGASTGIEQALGRPVDIAINHDPDALFMHAANHPQTVHLTEDVWQVDIDQVVAGRAVGLLWCSPDCTHHSRAKGGKPVSNARRGLAEVILNWAGKVRPRCIFLENVPEFTDWGPLYKKVNRPNPAKKGRTFRWWVKSLEEIGYKVEWKVLVASDYGTPTSRKRLYLIARCDSQPIVWPQPTHGPGLLPVHTASECIDWSIPGQSIFMTKEQAAQLYKETGVKVVRPLADHTMRRIALGVKKYIMDAADPFIIPIDHKSSKGCAMTVAEPLRTVTENRFALVSAFISKYYGGVIGSDIESPLHTITAIDHNALISTYLTKFYGTNIGSDMRKPVPTITATGQHLGQVSAFLVKYYGTNIGSSISEPVQTVTTRDRFGLVTIMGEDYQIVDITLRMLKPHELAAAQGFPEDYILTGTGSNQVAKIGNSVCPPMARVLVAANYGEISSETMVA